MINTQYRVKYDWWYFQERESYLSTGAFEDPEPLCILVVPLGVVKLRRSQQYNWKAYKLHKTGNFEDFCANVLYSSQHSH